MSKVFKIAFASILITMIVVAIGKVNAANLGLNVNFDGKKIEMTSETPDMTWQIKNLLPGETDETELTIYNIGKKNTTIKFLPKIEEGKELADILNVKIIKLAGENISKDEEFFNGKYSEIMNMGLSLDAGKTQKYKIITTLPSEAGNEYQKKECKVKLAFVASGIEDEEKKPEPEKPDEPDVPEKPEKPEEPEEPEEEPQKEITTDEVKPVQTGESKMIFAVVGVLALAVIILIITFFKGRK